MQYANKKWEVLVSGSIKQAYKSGFKRMVRGGMGEKSMPKQYSLELIYHHQWASNKNAAPVDAAFHAMCLQII